jgi:hypothetical protein
VVTQGTGCKDKVSVGTTVIDISCKSWTCTEHVGWQPTGSQNSLSTVDNNRRQQNNLNGGNNFVGGIPPSGPGGGTTGTQQVTIVASGDTTLEAIFKEMAYEAFLEIVE